MLAAFLFSFPMSKKPDIPSTARDLENLIRDFTYHNGLEVQQVFKDFLRFIVQSFSLPDTPPIPDWRYTPEQSGTFYVMLVCWVNIMQRELRTSEWHDAFGDLFMELTSKRDQEDRGQFFTPEDMCDLLTAIVHVKKKGTITLYDCAAGSSRTLLSGQAVNRGSFLYSQDVDYTCCLMSACNFLVHGCVGEVVCMNTISMRDFRGAWLVNEILYQTGIPTIRYLTEAEYVRLRMAKIPEYVYFLNQEAYDQYFHYRDLWQRFSNLFNDDTNQGTTDNG